LKNGLKALEMLLESSSDTELIDATRNCRLPKPLLINFIDASH
jgi:hypothetical protein